MTGDNVRAQPERWSMEKPLAWWGELVPSGCPGVGDAGAGTPAAGAAGVSPATAPDPIPPAADGGGH